jgi:hypothetical protein
MMLQIRIYLDMFPYNYIRHLSNLETFNLKDKLNQNVKFLNIFTLLGIKQNEKSFSNTIFIYVIRRNISSENTCTLSGNA